MKMMPLLTACLSFATLVKAYCPECTISLKSQWQLISSTADHADIILVARIIFKKKIKEPVKLTTITLQWHGAPIDHLCGSLYYQTPHKPFMAIEENMVCDSIWHAKKQQLTLPFKKQKPLAVNDTFSLVLTIPHTLSPLLKNGFFTIVAESLPAPFQKSAHNQKILIAST